MKTVRDLVYEQILAEGPDEYEGVYMTHAPTQERYVAHRLEHMPRFEFLERISDAIWRHSLMPK